MPRTRSPILPLAAPLALGLAAACQKGPAKYAYLLQFERIFETFHCEAGA